MSPEQVAARRLAALKSTPEADDLHWTLTCEAWRHRLTANAAAELMAIAGKMLLAGERLPQPLAEWLGEAMVGAAREKSSVKRRAALALRLGITAPRRRPEKFDRTQLREMLMAGISQRDLALELDVDRSTVQAWLADMKLTPGEEADLLRGVAIVCEMWGDLPRT